MLKKILFVLIIISAGMLAQPRGKQFGFGLMVGEPTGLTFKWWSQRDAAFVLDVGSSYFGSPRIQVDYIWHFNAFNSNIVNLYAGPGGAIGFGKSGGWWYNDRGDKFYLRTNNEVGLGARGIIGVNVVPIDTPLEIFIEAGLMIGLAPDFGSAVDGALGIRFYP